MTPTPIQEQAWDRMLTVQLNELYWAKKSYWLGVRLKAIQIFAAILGCAAFGTLFADPGFGLFNKLIALVAAILSLVLSIFDPKGALSQVQEAQKSHAILLAKCESLWNDIYIGLSEEDIAEKLSVLTEEMAEIKEPNVGVSKRLKVKSYNEICAARGLLADA